MDEVNAAAQREGVPAMKEPNLILPPKEVVKPTNISRRGFLRCLGITSLTLAVPSLIVPKEKKIIAQVSPGYIRYKTINCSGFVAYTDFSDDYHEFQEALKSIRDKFGRDITYND